MCSSAFATRVIYSTYSRRHLYTGRVVAEVTLFFTLQTISPLAALYADPVDRREPPRPPIKRSHTHTRQHSSV